MGQVESHPVHYEVVKRGEDFVIVTNEPAEFLDFEPAESYMVSYGIDLQTHPKFSHRTLSSRTVDDARQVTNAMTYTGVVPPNNTQLYAARQQPETCKIAGMRRTFQECAQKVGPNGLFIFHFSGHGIRVRNDEWGLAPVDFDYTRETYLTANVLNDWLHELGWKGKHILIILDCCYAGGIGKELTLSSEHEPVSSLYVLSACTAHETSLVIGPLGHSIFTFFLARAIKMFVSPQKAGQFPVQKVFRECQSCSIALSSLIVRYDPTWGLRWGTMQPEFKVLHLKAVVQELTGEGPEQTDARMARFEYAVQLYDYRKPISSLDDKSMAWLETAADRNGPLAELEKKRTLEGRVLDTVLCEMLYSVASIEMACDATKLANPNLFLTAFMSVAAAIDLVHGGIEFDEDQFLRGWSFYREVVSTNKVSDRALRELYHKAVVRMNLTRHTQNRTQSGARDGMENRNRTGVATEEGEDCTDSAELEQASSRQEDVLPEIPFLEEWIPLEDSV